MRRPLSLLLPLFAALTLSFARGAHAEEGDADANYNPGRQLRRSDFAMGFSMGGLGGTVSGYPKDANKINVAEYEAHTGFSGGTMGGFWLGAALRDWFVVGVGATFGSVAGPGATISRGGAFVLHLEGYPLFYKGGAFQDLGVIGEFGTGSRDISVGSVGAASSGAASYVAFGLKWEPIRIGKHISAGPIVEVAHQFSDRLEATFGIVGVQIAYYGGPD